jgi:predicted RNase H-like HicB family nuclease
MSKIVLFRINKGEDGGYIASASDYAIVTQGKTFENLLTNIREATEVHFDEKDTTQHPIMVNFDLSDMVYA